MIEAVLAAIAEALAFVQALVVSGWRGLERYVRKRPKDLILIALAVARALGTTIKSGEVGVLFSFGRVSRVLEPGFHWLIPLVQRVRRAPARAVTLNLAAQRVETEAGLVYDVDANLVFRMADPARAFVEIDNLPAGCRTVMALAIQRVLRGKSREALAARAGFDEELTAAVRERVAPWGVQVDTAGFTSIAPSQKTLRLTQLGPLVAERVRALAALSAGGLDPRAALAIGAGISARAFPLGARRRPLPQVRRIRLT